MFEAVSSSVDFSAMEKEILQFWQEQEVFRKSVDNRAGAKEYVFYDGPPFATGLPHYGHLLAGTIKDVVPRYRTMRGDRVQRTFGWD
ncbi:MAG: class I tRNA ligase family protein, partial [Lentisphaeria bacterium]|nr:class I tRNA ligase family protein [Lentisphaeria bacterium]